MDVYKANISTKQPCSTAEKYSKLQCYWKTAWRIQEAYCLEFQRIKSFIYWHNSKTFHEWGNKWLLDCKVLLCTLVSSVMLAVGLLKWEKHNRESSCNPRLDGSMMTHVEEITTQPVGLYCVLFAWSTNWMRCVNMRERGKERERERERLLFPHFLLPVNGLTHFIWKMTSH